MDVFEQWKWKIRTSTNKTKQTKTGKISMHMSTSTYTWCIYIYVTKIAYMVEFWSCIFHGSTDNIVNTDKRFATLINRPYTSLLGPAGVLSQCLHHWLCQYISTKHFFYYMCRLELQQCMPHLHLVSAWQSTLRLRFKPRALASRYHSLSHVAGGFLLPFCPWALYLKTEFINYSIRLYLV